MSLGAAAIGRETGVVANPNCTERDACRATRRPLDANERHDQRLCKNRSSGPAAQALEAVRETPGQTTTVAATRQTKVQQAVSIRFEPGPSKQDEES